MDPVYVFHSSNNLNYETLCYTQPEISANQLSHTQAHGKLAE